MITVVLKLFNNGATAVEIAKNDVFHAKNWIIGQKYGINSRKYVKIAVFLASNGLIIEKLRTQSENYRFLAQRKGQFQAKN